MIYDGSINIDTRVDPSGMNKGVKNISAKLGGILQAVKSFALVAGAFLAKAFSIVGVAAFFAAFQGAISAVRENLATLFERAGIKNELEGLQARFAELKLAAANAFMPLITAALPYVQQVTNWLIMTLNKVAMIMAALLGQKSVLQVIPGSLTKAGKALEKSARGALASFDQINVLDLDKKKNPIADIVTELVPIDTEVISQIDNIMRAFDEFKKWFSWDFIKQKAIEIWEDIKQWFQENGASLFKGLALGGLAQLLKIKEWISENAADIFEGFTLGGVAQFLKIKEWLDENGAKIFEGFSIGGAVQVIKGKLDELKEWLIVNVWEPIKSKFAEMKDGVAQMFRGLVAWLFGNVFAPFKQGFASTLDWVREKFFSIFTNIAGFVTGILNKILDGINTVVSSIFDLKMPSGDSLGVSVGGNFSSRIPRLATGAVIPPNSEFAAILGDQRSGKNIEAPESLIRRIFREEAGGNQNQTITINFTGSGAEIARMLKPELDREYTRVGKSMVKGGTGK